MSLEDILEQLSNQLEEITEYLEDIAGVLTTGDWSNYIPRETARPHLIEVGSSQEEPPPPDPPSTSERTIELIALSKKMGFAYIYDEDRDMLVVDNRVLDEYNRAHLPDTYT